jgi:hypothetical protein
LGLREELASVISGQRSEKQRECYHPYMVVAILFMAIADQHQKIRRRAQLATVFPSTYSSKFGSG